MNFSKFVFFLSYIYIIYYFRSPTHGFGFLRSVRLTYFKSISINQLVNVFASLNYQVFRLP